MGRRTPGPWGLRGHQIRADGGQGAHVADYRISAADGMLIAAAPTLLVMLHDAIARAESCGGSEAHAWEIKERLAELGLATLGVDEFGHRSAKADLEDRNPDIERKP